MLFILKHITGKDIFPDVILLVIVAAVFQMATTALLLCVFLSNFYYQLEGYLMCPEAENQHVHIERNLKELVMPIQSKVLV